MTVTTNEFLENYDVQGQELNVSRKGWSKEMVVKANAGEEKTKEVLKQNGTVFVNEASTKKFSSIGNKIANSIINTVGNTTAARLFSTVVENETNTDGEAVILL